MNIKRKEGGKDTRRYTYSPVIYIFHEILSNTKSNKINVLYYAISLLIGSNGLWSRSYQWFTTCILAAHNFNMQDYTRQIEQVMPSFITQSNLERALDRQNSVLRYQQILYNYRVIDKIISIPLDYFIFDSRYISLYLIIEITRMNLILIDWW